MKILFLDIDGVLNSTRSTFARTGDRVKSEEQKAAIAWLKMHFAVEDLLPYGPTFTISTIDPVAVDLVNRLLKKDADLFIVLSSTHRSHFCGPRSNNVVFGSPEHIEILQYYLTALGLKGDRLIGVTDQLRTRRGIEVRSWINAHIDCEYSVAIDDGADFEPADCNFVRIDPIIGFSAKDYYDVTKHLNIAESFIITSEFS